VALWMSLCMLSIFVKCVKHMQKGELNAALCLLLCMLEMCYKEPFAGISNSEMSAESFQK
jgi:hypothetical protein